MRIGIVGAGQHGRMMALAGIPLGIEFTMYDTHADVPGAAVTSLSFSCSTVGGMVWGMPHGPLRPREDT